MFRVVRPRRTLTSVALCAALSLTCRDEPAAPAPASAAPTPAPQAASTPPPRELFTHERPCMGTRCTILIFHDDATGAERAVDAAMKEIDRLDRLMTTWLETSDVSRINAAAGDGRLVKVSPETFEVLRQSKWVAGVSGGAFDVTVGAFKGLWRFDEDRDGTLPSPRSVRERLSLVDHEGLVLSEASRSARLKRAGQRITLGGIAKGFVVDRAVAVLRGAGLVDFLVQAGGDLYASGQRGDRPWRVGIQDPRANPESGRSTDTSFAMLSLSNSAFNTSGDYERFVIQGGRRYHHILDPRTGFPVTTTRSVTVLAPTSFQADTLDTAIFVMGPQSGMKLVEGTPGVEAVIVDAHNVVHVSSGLQGRLHQLRPPTDGI